MLEGTPNCPLVQSNKGEWVAAPRWPGKPDYQRLRMPLLIGSRLYLQSENARGHFLCPEHVALQIRPGGWKGALDEVRPSLVHDIRVEP